LALLKVTLVGGTMTRWDSYRVWWKISRSRRRSYTRPYWRYGV